MGCTESAPAPQPAACAAPRNPPPPPEPCGGDADGPSSPRRAATPAGGGEGGGVICADAKMPDGGGSGGAKDEVESDGISVENRSLSGANPAAPAMISPPETPPVASLLPLHAARSTLSVLTGVVSPPESGLLTISPLGCNGGRQYTLTGAATASPQVVLCMSQRVQTRASSVQTASATDDVPDILVDSFFERHEAVLQRGVATQDARYLTVPGGAQSAPPPDATPQARTRAHSTPPRPLSPPPRLLPKMKSLVQLVTRPSRSLRSRACTAPPGSLAGGIRGAAKFRPENIPGPRGAAGGGPRCGTPASDCLAPTEATKQRSLPAKLLPCAAVESDDDDNNDAGGCMESPTGGPDPRLASPQDGPSTRLRRHASSSLDFDAAGISPALASEAPIARPPAPPPVERVVAAPPRTAADDSIASTLTASALSTAGSIRHRRPAGVAPLDSLEISDTAIIEVQSISSLSDDGASLRLDAPSTSDANVSRASIATTHTSSQSPSGTGGSSISLLLGDANAASPRSARSVRRKTRAAAAAGVVQPLVARGGASGGRARGDATSPSGRGGKVARGAAQHVSLVGGVRATSPRARTISPRARLSSSMSASGHSVSGASSGRATPKARVGSGSGRRLPPTRKRASSTSPSSSAAGPPKHPSRQAASLGRARGRGQR